ncbi:hypothetical protein Acr_16g0000180 [Actinidia rufa]|uniref:Uncharacterized protein n=1 Tax=Actinidia rufa TaxID=165716 RepID=A0A7J0FXT4_9ERIC|nr:hypothetical protein Acr_16g0000180 [Actinidia rufa]
MINFCLAIRLGLQGIAETPEGTMREHVKQISSLLLDIRDMSEEDKLFNFMIGVQNWAQLELCCMGIKDFSAAITAVDSLVEYKLGNPSTSESRKTSKQKGKDKKLDKKGMEYKSGWKNGKDNGSKFKSKADDSQSVRKACLDKMANVQDNDVAEHMQGASGVVPECVTVYADNSQRQLSAVSFCREQQIRDCRLDIAVTSSYACLEAVSTRGKIGRRQFLCLSAGRIL